MFPIPLMLLVAFGATGGMIAADNAEELPEQHAGHSEISTGKVIRTEIQRVVVPVSVFTLGGETVGELTRDDFKLFVDECEIEEFQLLYDVQMPTVITVVFDHSSSSVQKNWSWTKSFIRELIHHLTTEDVFSLATYGWKYDRICGPTSDRIEIMERLDNLYPELFFKKSSFWDFLKRDVRDMGKQEQLPGNKTAIALDLSLTDMLRQPHPKKYLILISDGDENLSKITLNHVQSYGIPIYSIFFSGSGFGRHSLFRRGSLLRTISEETGGVVFKKTKTMDPASVAGETARMIRNHYLLSFSPSDELNRNKTHSIRVVLNRSNVRTNFRRSFRFSKE